VVAGGPGAVTTPQILVVGGGPTGLATALQAHWHGATVRVVEQRPDAFRPSRAMIMHSRTMEVLRPLGVTDDLLERGDTAPLAELHLGTHRVRAELAEVDLPDTAFPHLTLIRQSDVEDVLATHLDRRGVRVERGVSLVSATTSSSPGGHHVRTDLDRAGRHETVRCRYLAGCDGPASLVRHEADIGWSGGSYAEEVVLADVELEGDLAPGILHVAAGRAGLAFAFALGEDATWRVLTTRRRTASRGEDFGQTGDRVPPEEVETMLRASGLPARISDLVWSARVPLQHRLADAFRRDRLFLAGDAAHAHSPAAAQGMNTGIIDAVNLGWKLALAAQHDHRSALLDSYEMERRPAAREVLALTHLVFFAEASTNPAAALVRGHLAPLAAPLLPLALRQRRLMGVLVRALSQGWVRYRGSPISREGRAGGPGPPAGDRLPDRTVTTDGVTARLHDLTARPGLHLLAQRDCPIPSTGPTSPVLTAHRIDSWPGAGLLVARPDGHVGYRSGTLDPRDLDDWLEAVGVPPR
jgi:2-polyprenyl-6-methoxyphenol hydroxylase-like FAD-dependent oxidoreductase